VKANKETTPIFSWDPIKILGTHSNWKPMNFVLYARPKLQNDSVETTAGWTVTRGLPVQSLVVLQFKAQTQGFCNHLDEFPDKIFGDLRNSYKICCIGRHVAAPHSAKV